MSQFHWALAALLTLSLFACDGGGPSGDGHNTDDTDTGTQIQPGTGGVMVHAEFEGNLEECFVNVNGQELGPTESEIMNLAPGQLDFQLGSMETTTLDGIPLHETDTNKFLLGGGSVTVVEGVVTPVTVEMTEAPQYHCESHQCDWPYEGGGNCDSMLDSEDQWIYVGNDGVLHGSDKDSFGGQGSVVIELSMSGELTVTPTDSDLQILDLSYDLPASFEYTRANDAAQSSSTVTCSMR